MKLIFPALCLLVCINQAHSLLGYSFGSCPNLPIIKDFDINAYKGVWYEAAVLPNEFSPPFATCVHATYDTVYNAKGEVVPNQVSVFNFGKYVIGGVNFYNVSIKGFAYPLFPNAPNMLDVVFNVPEITPEIIAAAQEKMQPNYNVIDTDYKNYALVYSCYTTTYLGFLPVRKEYAFVLTRHRKVNNLTELLNKFNAYTDSSLIRVTDQTNC